MADLLGRRPADLVGARLTDLAEPVDIKASEWLLRSAIEARHPVDLQMRCRLSNGRTRWMESRVIPLMQDGQETNVVLTRPIQAPRGLSAGPELRSYLSDMSAQLARMAIEAGLTSTAEALSAGAVLAEAEGA